MTSLCEVCSDAEETISHVLLRCPTIVQISRCLPIPPLSLWESVEDMLKYLSDSLRRPSIAEIGIKAAYAAYHIWLERNDCLFEGRRSSPRVVKVRDIWNTCTAVSASRFIYFSWVLPPSDYFKVNFDGGMAVDGAFGGVGFVIRNHDSRFIAMGGHSTPGMTAVAAELRATWKGILCARRVLGADSIFLEGDSSTVIDCIRRVDKYGDGHPLIRDTRKLVREFTSFQIVHMYLRRIVQQTESPPMQPGTPHQQLQ
ncbi:uncharacterized protein LOC120110638 [Phoenix dactylifera]|uniref:Uncharacterized protein LOC120110638 n=1 Tax=Phoenix dactylifera TaxID=42345 RepID=A0A8B9A673_PHODC|nr:uncharacterized protein LOC120110638 [Phoenix dactylifera]